MQLVEQHVIDKHDQRFSALDCAAFASKNLYNAANYIVRQSFIHERKYLGYAEVFHRIKHHEAYKALPRKVSNDILRLLDKNWKAFFKALKAYNEDPSKFLGRPRLPKYKEKDGRNVLIYDIQALSKTGLRKGLIIPSQLNITIQTKQTNVKQARIVPRNSVDVGEVVYECAEAQAEVDPKLVAGIDIGLNNLAAVTSNKSGFVPRVVNGRPIKSINQWYNKERGKLQAILSREKRSTSHKLDQLTNRRTRRIDHYLHTASKRIISLLVQEGIGTLIIGKNPEWKQEINIGKRNNQNFVQVPHARFIQMLTYKAQLVGIQVILTEESHTSKCSFLDSEEIGHHDYYVGRRIKRGMFRSQFGTLINADVNGSYNIIRKVASDAFERGCRGCAVHPVPLAIGA